MTIDEAINSLTVARMEVNQLQQAIQTLNSVITQEEREVLEPGIQQVYQRLQQTIQHGVSAIQTAAIDEEEPEDDE